MESAAMFLNKINAELAKLAGMKVKKSDEYHQAKQKAIIPFLKQGLKYSMWNITNAQRVNIFVIHLSIKRDKRVKNGMVGEILETIVMPSPEYIDIDTTLPLDKYLTSIDKINIEIAIETTKEQIEQTKISLSEQVEHLHSLHKKLQEIK